MRYYTVSDLHGYYTELMTALNESGFFEDTQPHKLVICGDLFDRGHEIVEMQDFIVDLLRKDQVILVRGNHEDLFCDLLDTIEYVMTYNVHYSHHWINGTVQTLLDLTKMYLTRACVQPDICAKRARNTPFVKEILPAMVDYFETKKYIFVHGWIPCAQRNSNSYIYLENWRDLDYDNWKSARWLNGMLLSSKGITEPNKTIICGHVSCSYGHATFEHKGTEDGKDADYSPYYGDGVIAIDGSTYASRKVNVVILEDE